MSNYNNDTLDLIQGATPKEKYDNLKALLEICERIVYPRRGSEDDQMQIEQAANLLQPYIKNPNL